MKELLEILEAHKSLYSGDECECGWSYYHDDLVLNYTDHLAELLKPLLAEVWQDGHRTGSTYNGHLYSNPYKEETE